MRCRGVGTGALCLAALLVLFTGSPGAQPPAAVEPQEAPRDLRPLLVAPQSEMRLVVQRYTLDGNTLNGNYLAGGRQGGPGGGRGGRGGGGDAQATAAATHLNTSVSLSPNRIARLKRSTSTGIQALRGRQRTSSGACRFAAYAARSATAASAPGRTSTTRSCARAACRSPCCAWPCRSRS